MTCPDCTSSPVPAEDVQKVVDAISKILPKPSAHRVSLDISLECDSANAHALMLILKSPPFILNFMRTGVPTSATHQENE